MTRRTAREIAMHLIYEMDFHPDGAEEILAVAQEHAPRFSGESTLYDQEPDSVQKEYIARCVRGFSEKQDEIDGIISKYAVGWKLTRISRVTLAILRLSVYEILYVEDAPAGSVINEAVEIARGYEEEDKVSFINGILGAFVRDLP